MPSTHTCLYFHVVFATKHREASIDPAWKPRLHEYLGGVVRGLGGVPLGVGGVEDHVHLLVALKSTHRLADFMRDLKRSSSDWVGRELGCPTFHWQEGYAAFSVSPTAIVAVQGYIARQEAHHQSRTFRDELVAVLKTAGVRYDERYLD